MLAGLTFHHHGLALNFDGEALTMLRLLGYSMGEQVHDPVLNVNLRLCVHPAFPAVEIVLRGSERGPLDALLRRHDQLLYHSCYEVADREAVLAALEEAGLRVVPVLPPTPAVLFEGRLVSFHTILGFGLIELLDQTSPIPIRDGQ